MGEYAWDDMPRLTGPKCLTPGDRSYRKEFTYRCPSGYIFDTTGVEPKPPEASEMNWRCAEYGDWYPPIRPKCIPADCDDPVSVTNTSRGMWNWDLKKRSYLHTIDYWCPTKGWGFPATGERRMTSSCQANGEWTIKDIDDCTLLPCADQPPKAPKGGWMWFDLLDTQYKCPHGYKFETGDDLYSVVCTAARHWSREELPKCIRKTYRVFQRMCPTETGV